MLKFEILIVNLVQIFYNLEARGFKSHPGEYKRRGGAGPWSRACWYSFCFRTLTRGPRFEPGPDFHRGIGIYWALGAWFPHYRVPFKGRARA